MPASEARILANQKNAALSTGPKTIEGKARSRANAYKHGLTGAGVVMPEEDAVEVERLAKDLRNQFKPTGPVGHVLVRRMATLAVRMDRCFDQETAALSERVRTVMAEFVPPEGVDAETAAKLRIEAGNIALFDPSKTACLARKYDAAAERGFYRTLKELRQLEKAAKAADPVVEARAYRDSLGSFSQLEKMVTDLEARIPEPVPFNPPPIKNPILPTDYAPRYGSNELPITIGRRR